jgi:hypothetical protein
MVEAKETAGERSGRLGQELPKCREPERGRVSTCGFSWNYLSTMERGTVEIGAEILLRIGREFVKPLECC